MGAPRYPAADRLLICADAGGSNGHRSRLWKVLPDIEYPSNVYCWMNLASRGVGIKWVRNRAGRVLGEDIAAMIDARTRLVSLSAVQFSNGFRQDLAPTAELCRSRGVLLNLDAIQHLGVLHLDVDECPIDYLSAGGHKWLLGPIGTGAFYCRRSALERLRPHNIGYHSIAKDADHLDYDLTFRPDAGRFEEALVNVPGLWGLEAAVDMLLALGDVDPGLLEPRVEVIRRPARVTERDDPGPLGLEPGAQHPVPLRHEAFALLEALP